MADLNLKNGLNATHISSNLSAYEAARTSFFSFIVDVNNQFKNLAKTSYGGTVGEARGNDLVDMSNGTPQDILKLNVTKCNIPHFSLETLTYRRGNEVVKYAGVPTFGEGSITVDDIVGVDTKSILMAWQGLAYNINTRKGGRMKDYKKDCDLIEYTQDYEVIRTWHLYGCWVSDISEDGFDKENDGKRQITAKIEYDRAEMEMPEIELE